LEQQQLLAEESLLRFCEPPHSTNLSAVCPEALSGLFEASRQGLFLRSVEGEKASEDGKMQRLLTDSPPSSQWTGAKPTPQSPSALSLLGRLRWASVGRHFDWTSRRYTLPHLPPLPVWLCDWAADLVQSILATSSGAGRRPSPSSMMARADEKHAWYPDTGLVNYYRPGDTLGGHVDDAEKTMEDPILSLSLGLPAVFLIGGPTRDEKPLALLLRAGDALLFSAQARRCYHGVPRVLLDRDVEARDRALQGGPGDQSCASLASPRVWQTPPMHPAQLSRPESVQDWLRHVRINVSLRLAG
ncbi:2OG-Fe(II) oxygenase, partial [Helicosporidium sp. ATCC 50920]